MKRLLHASTMLLGSLLTAGLLAAGTFQVPFDFEVSGKVLPSGRYEVSRLSLTSPVYKLYNRDTGKQTLVSLPVSVEAPRAGQPRMVFRCHGADCAVAEVWPQAGAGAARIVRRPAAKPLVIDTTN